MTRMAAETNGPRGFFRRIMQHKKSAWRALFLALVFRLTRPNNRQLNGPIQNGYRRRSPIVDLTPKSHGFWKDLKTGRWVVVPGASKTYKLLTTNHDPSQALLFASFCFPYFYISIGSSLPLSSFLIPSPAPSLPFSSSPILLRHQRTTLPIPDTVRVGLTSYSLPTTSSSSLLSVSRSSIKSAILSRNTLASARRKSSLVSVNRVMRSFISHFSAHGVCRLCHNFRPGGTTVNTSGLVRCQSFDGDS
jgi:hypothetical protein